MIQIEYQDEAINHIAKRTAKAFTPPPCMAADEWADKYRELSRAASAKGGKWRSRCYQREIMRECTNPEVRSVVFVAAAQTGGKSEIIINFIGRQIHLNPGPMMLVQPTNELAERFSKKRISPAIRETRVLRDLVGDQKSRATGNTIKQKEFPGGTLNIAGANTPNELCSDPIRDILIDEVDRCEKAAGREGDIVTLAEARQESFEEQAFSLFTSTPSGDQPKPEGEAQPEGVSKILMLFNESDQRHWFCPCQKCDKHQTLKWSQVVWPNNKPQEARYVCEFGECLHPHTDAERIAMIEAGEWRGTAPFTGRRGYFLNGIYSLSGPQRGCVSKLHQMARDFLRAARRGVEALRAWTNTFLCECFAGETAETVDGDVLFKRREEFGPKLPAPVCFLTAGTDVHPDRIECQIIGWGAGERGWPIDYGIFLGDTKKPEVWKELDTFLLQKFDHPCGAQIGIERAAVDTGHSTDEAYEFCRPRSLRGVIAVKGMKGFGAPLMNPPRKSGVRKVRLWIVAKNTALKTIHARLKQSEPGDGYIHFRSDHPSAFGEEYFKQLTANEVITIKRAGVELQDFSPGQRRDEAMDTFVYALAALRQRPVDFGKVLSRMLDSVKEEVKDKPKPKPIQRQASSLVRNALGSW